MKKRTSSRARKRAEGARAHASILAGPGSVRPVQIGAVNWVGLMSLYFREVQRFGKIPMQTILAPALTSALFLMVFAVAVGERAALVVGVDFVAFLVPGLVMMSVLQNAFANTTSSIMISKVQGNIIDLLMPPIGPGEFLIGMASGGMTRGIAVGLASYLVLGPFVGLGVPDKPFAALTFLILGSLAMSLAGIAAGIWSMKFDQMAAVTNFVVQPLAFLSGTFYSVNRLPAPFDTIATFNPAFYAIDGFRYGILGFADRPVATGIMVLCLVNLLFGCLCYLMLRSGYRLKS